MKKFFLAISAITLAASVQAHTQTPVSIQKVGMQPSIPVTITVTNGRKFTTDMWIYVGKAKVGELQGLASGASRRFTVGIKTKEDEERHTKVCTEAHPSKHEIKVSFISRVCTTVKTYRYPSKETTNE